MFKPGFADRCAPVPTVFARSLVSLALGCWMQAMRPEFARALLVPSLVLSTLACSPQKPTVTPVAARVMAVGNTGLSLDVDIDVHNPNSFPIMAQLVEGTVLLGNGAVLGHGAARPPGSIPANGAARVTTRLDVPWVNVAALAPFAFSAQPVPYVFRGQATIWGESLNIKVPFELNGMLTRDQLLAAGLRGL